MGCGGLSHSRSERSYLKLRRKINGNLQLFEKFHELGENFDLKKLILMKIKAILMEFWKDLINLKEIKKPSGIFFAFGLKTNEDWSFLIYIRKSQWKIDFLPIFYPILLELCHFIQLSKRPQFFYIFSVSGGKNLPPPGGDPAISPSPIIITPQCKNDVHRLLQ